jgi:hypothetical protein
MQVSLGRLSARDYEELKSRQAQRFKEDVKILPPPPSRTAKVTDWEQVRLALLTLF